MHEPVSCIVISCLLNCWGNFKMIVCRDQKCQGIGLSPHSFFVTCKAQKNPAKLFAGAGKFSQCIGLFVGNTRVIVLLVMIYFRPTCIELLHPFVSICLSVYLVVCLFVYHPYLFVCLQWNASPRKNWC